MQLYEGIFSLTRSPVDGSERPEDPQHTEDLEESDAGATEYGDEGDGDHHDVQAIEGLRKRVPFFQISFYFYMYRMLKNKDSAVRIFYT
jgi:hypothetical protein